MLTFIKMKKDIEKIIEIPENVQVTVNGTEIIVKSQGKEIKKSFNIKNIDLKLEGNKIKVSSKKATKRESTLIGTLVANLKNMINGMKDEFVYQLEVCNVHFPMTVKVEGNKMIIKTFLGEIDNRIAEIVPGVKVEIKGKDIFVSSFNRDAAGQTAANIEQATKITGRDRRVFQDGIFLVRRYGKEI